jgi:hypothetical protein
VTSRPLEPWSRRECRPQYVVEPPQAVECLFEAALGQQHPRLGLVEQADTVADAQTRPDLFHHGPGARGVAPLHQDADQERLTVGDADPGGLQ